MKKTISFILALALVGGMVSCSAPKPSESSGTSANTPDDPTQQSRLDLRENEEIKTYRNPLISGSDGTDHGDPFVMRYNGKYYMYTTASGINCWSSTDLVNWKSEGKVSRDSTVTGVSAYAPEVVYYNGAFYMYTSPNGNGHYVLSSDSPTGPFRAISSNIGMSIDGSVFIDNDGSWYFYTAGGNEIAAYRMSSPSKMTGAGNLSALSLNGWTEGPMVIYHDGSYYVTYTGNHFKHRAYRINYGVSTRSPLTFQTPERGPMIISTTDAIHSIGHSSTVKGPDLDSYYLVYHSYEGNYGHRSVNIDRLVFNGNDLSVMGPTVVSQQVPSMPDVYSNMAKNSVPDGWTLQGKLGEGNCLTLSEGGMILSDQKLGDRYTAEYNLASIGDGSKAGVVFSYTDSENYGMLVCDPKTQTVKITFVVDKAVTTKEVGMIRSFKEDVKFDCIQAIEVERNAGTFTFYMNDRELCKLESALGGGSIGYLTEVGTASFGFIGGTNAVGGNGSAGDYKSVSDSNGLIPASSYTIGEFATAVKSKINTVKVEQGDILNYRILASRSGGFDLSATYYTADKESPMRARVYLDGSAVIEFDLAAGTSLATEVVRGIPIDKGQHTIAIEIVSGSGGFSEFNLVYGNPNSSLDLTFESSIGKAVYSDGNWKARNGVLNFANASECGKILYGNRNWGDYTVEVDIQPTDKINCGLLVRGTNPGAANYRENSPSSDDAARGTDWIQGYYVGLSSTGVILAKQNYSYQSLANAKGSYEVGKSYHLKVVCEGASFSIYVDGNLVLEYTDKDPFLQGMVGVRSCRSAVRFDNLKVYPNEG